MKITPVQRQQMIGAYSKSKVQGTTAAPGAGMKPDAVEISPEGASFSETFRAVMQAVQQEEAPAYRERREELAEQVREGAYEVPADEVASAMLRGLKIDRQV